MLVFKVDAARGVVAVADCERVAGESDLGGSERRESAKGLCTFDDVRLCDCCC